MGWGRGQVADGQRGHSNPHLRRPGGQLPLVPPLVHPQQQVEAGVTAFKGAHLGQTGVPGGGQQGLPPGLVPGAGAVQVALKVAPVHEPGQSILLEGGDGGGVEPELPPPPLHQVGGSTM